MSKTSKIARFQKCSQTEKDFFSDESFIRKKRIEYCEGEMYRRTGISDSYEVTDKFSIDILQVLIFGDNQYLVEYELGEKIGKCW